MYAVLAQTHLERMTCWRDAFHACFLRESAVGHTDAMMSTYKGGNVPGPALKPGQCSAPSACVVLVDCSDLLRDRLLYWPSNRPRTILVQLLLPLIAEFIQTSSSSRMMCMYFLRLSYSVPQVCPFRHEVYGGIYPYSAIASHQNNMVCPPTRHISLNNFTG
jgi:hypothetical protein